MISVEPSLEQLSLSDKLAMSYDQVSETVEQVESSSSSSSSSDQEEEMKNYTFEPLIAGDFPVSIRKQTAPNKEDQKKKNKKEKLDLSSESAFPSLSSSSNPSTSTAAASASCWSSAASRVKTQPTQPIKSTTISSTSNGNVKRGASNTNVTQVTDVLEITGDKQIANHPKKPENFKGNTQIIQEVMSRTNTNIIASTNLSGTSTYLIQGASNDVARAKYELMANIAIKSS